MFSVLLFNFKKFKFAFLDLSRPFYVDDWQKSKPCVKLSYRYVFLYWTRSPSPPSPSTAQQSKKGKKKEKFSRKDLAARKRPTHRQLLSFFLPPPHRKLSAVISFLISASLLSLKSFHPQNFGASSILRIKGQSRDLYPCFFLSWFYPIWSAYFSA